MPTKKSIAKLKTPIKPLSYLASPYALYPAGAEEAFRDICAIAGHLIEAGVNLYCPIAHCHPIATYAGLALHAAAAREEERDHARHVLDAKQAQRPRQCQTIQIFEGQDMIKEHKCLRCNDTGFIEFLYRDVADASGPFYDQDIVYELKAIRKPCPICRGAVLEQKVARWQGLG